MGLLLKKTAVFLMDNRFRLRCRPEERRLLFIVVAPEHQRGFRPINRKGATS